MSEALYQKLGVAVNRLALDLLTRQEGERIPSISEYQEKFQFSRGTVQNALAFPKESDAVELVSRGHLGTFIDRLDYRRLQECSFNKELLGESSMRLLYQIIQGETVEPVNLIKTTPVERGTVKKLAE